MKKTFELTHPKIAQARLVESIKHDVKKYIRRERRRELPEGVQFWDFNCKIGNTAEDSKPVHVDDISKGIDEIVAQELKSFYLEVIAKEGHRAKKPRPPEVE